MISPGLSGGISVSTMLPWTFEIMIDDEVLAKAFWMTTIIRMPGARNWRNGTSPTGPRRAAKASPKTVMNSTEVATGARMVCAQTPRNRIASRLIRVHRPIQFTCPKRRCPCPGIFRGCGPGIGREWSSGIGLVFGRRCPVHAAASAAAESGLPCNRVAGA